MDDIKGGMKPTAELSVLAKQGFISMIAIQTTVVQSPNQHLALLSIVDNTKLVQYSLNSVQEILHILARYTTNFRNMVCEL